jgi:hypothetical protein
VVLLHLRSQHAAAPRAFAQVGDQAIPTPDLSDIRPVASVDFIALGEVTHLMPFYVEQEVGNAVPNVFTVPIPKRSSRFHTTSITSAS